MPYPYDSNNFSPGLQRAYRRGGGLRGIAMTHAYGGSPSLLTPVAQYKNGMAAVMNGAVAPPPPPPASTGLDLPLIGPVPGWAVLLGLLGGAWFLYDRYR